MKWRRTGSFQSAATNSNLWPTSSWTFFSTESAASEPDESVRQTSVCRRLRKLMVEIHDKAESVGRRVPLSADEPATLVDVYERVVSAHPQPDTLNYKRDG